MKNKKNLIILLVIIVIVIVVIATITIQNKNKEDKTKTSFEDNTLANSVVTVEDIEFKDITKTYESGITTIRANVYNNTNQTKDINVKIILKDDNGKEVKNMIQILEQVEPKRKSVLSTGITGDYTNIKDIQFKIISESEIQ